MKNIPKWVWLIIGLICLGFVAAGLSAFFLFFSLYKDFNGSGSPVKVVEEQLNDLKRGNTTAAYNLISTSEKVTLTQDQFNTLVKTYPALSINKSDFFSNEKISNDQATLIGTLTAEDGTKTPIQYKLINENGVWKIYSITVNPAN